MAGIRATLLAATMGATAAVPVAAGSLPDSSTPPAFAMAVTARAACPPLDADPELAAVAVAVGLSESGGNPTAVGDQHLEDSRWGPSVGWWQIRSLRAQHGTGQARDETRLADPAFNAASMCEISGGGANWDPWTEYTNGDYRSRLAEAREAVAATAGVNVALPGVGTLGEAVPAPQDAMCEPPTGRSVAVVAERLWCNALVRPWLALGRNPANTAWWSKLDGWLFGRDKPEVEPAAAPRAAGGVTCPVVTGVEVGDGWGAGRGGGTRAHEGIDVFGAKGSPMVAPFDGVVSATSSATDGGNGGASVTVRRTDGFAAYLAHADRVDVAVGDRVRAGQQVGTVGNSGNAGGTPAHVHAQVYPAAGGGPVPAGPTIGEACGHNPDGRIA